MVHSIVGAIVAAVLLAIVWRIQRLKHSVADRVPGARWQRTDEVIEDPVTKQMVRVWVDPADGSRHYVPERFPSRRPD
jgi:hypothetical protein